MSAAEQRARPEAVVVHEVLEQPVSLRKRVVTGALLVLVGAVTVVGWGLGAGAGDATFAFGGGTAVRLPDLTLPATATAVLLGAVVVVLGLFQLVRGFRARRGPLLVGAAVAAFMVSFLCWAMSGGEASSIDVVQLLRQTLFLATPLILGALAGVLGERSGVVNVAIEGQLLTGAFTAALVGTLAGSLGAGVVGGVLSGALVGWLLAVFAIRYRVNQVILGVVLNAAALGFTGWAYKALMQSDTERFNAPGQLQTLPIPVLSDIPVLGPLLFEANVVVYVMYALVVALQVVLFRTRWGLRTRAVGEHPKAAATLGVPVLRIRYVNVVVAGGIAGLGGAFLSVGTIGPFTENMSAGKGFIALAAVIFGRWTPKGAVAASLLFGFFAALQTLVGVLPYGSSVPSSFLSALPYLATLFAVAGFVGRVRPPAASGEPYPA
ncbi:inner-membrane translocator [Kineococcus radiotolerans SRS30216 = ATCC BAA-149]|uniref:Inner-membrane translocator n=1 Tax=Kineococcus radiotolerans (strain ATCC BAA-149 / DSM 14245 / SRS30216) TaxID=266940 RepID=A6WF20_KINRD|nr:inner-membrane translocator [Kineococcus radiotolerans SRS30216 = ATCC BAA-149]